MQTSDFDFYWTVACGSTRKAIRVAAAANRGEPPYDLVDSEIEADVIPDPEIAMVSFATKNNIPFEGVDWMIDSGGFSTLYQDGDYEASITEYVDYLEKYEDRIHRYVLRDWACERELLREWGRDVRQHQNWTIRDHVECRERVEARRLDMEPVAVLQGYDLEDYLYHFEYLREHGLLTDHLGIGSVCRRNKGDEIRSLLLQLRQEIPDKITLHGFGVKKTILSDPAVAEALDSVDSNAWDMPVSKDPAISNKWDNILAQYVDYYQDLEAKFEAASAGSQEIQVFSLAQFNGGLTVPESIQPLVECRCGNLLDPNDLDRCSASCRSCHRALMNWELAKAGGLCDPDIDSHHPLCPHPPSESSVDTQAEDEQQSTAAVSQERMTPSPHPLES